MVLQGSFIVSMLQSLSKIEKASYFEPEVEGEYLPNCQHRFSEFGY